jgi:hypothetical protein
VFRDQKRLDYTRLTTTTVVSRPEGHDYFDYFDYSCST